MTDDPEQQEEHHSPANVIAWQALEYPYFEKGGLWYLILASVTAGLVALALTVGDVILAILVLVAAFTVGVFGARKPDVINVRIEGTTVLVGENNEYDLQEMKSFWIYYEPPNEPELMLRSERFLMPLVRIPLDDQDPLTLRRYLRELLPEEKEELSLADRLARIVRF